MLRIIRIVLSPQDEWQQIAGEGWHAALLYAFTLALLPTFASFVMTRTSELELPQHAVLFTYFASALGVLVIAAAFGVLARMFSPNATLARCVKVAAYGATPVFVATALLVAPVLVIVCVVWLLHVFYLYYLDARRRRGRRPRLAIESSAWTSS